MDKAILVEMATDIFLIGKNATKTDMGSYTVMENDYGKIIRSPEYNSIFRKKDGNFKRWGKTFEEDPEMAPAPEILDIEITTICHGVPAPNKNNSKEPNKESPCAFCYKSNTPNGKNMSFETFKNVLDKISEAKVIQQLAFGADSKAESNPDLWKMADYARSKGIVPNITVANITDETADKIVKVMGACAVSRYEDKNLCYDSAKKLIDRGLSQVNIHILVCEQTYDWIMETLQDRLTDSRLEKLKAVVLLSLKKRGRGKRFTPLSAEKFKKIVDFAFENNIGIGFDSCSCARVFKAVENHPNFDMIVRCGEPCESSLFSSYVDVDGVFMPCSFSPGYAGWDNGISVVNCNNFISDVWKNEKVEEFRASLLSTKTQNKFACRECPLFDIEG